MDPVPIGIIGGSGTSKMEGITFIEEVELETPYGRPTDSYKLVELEGQRVAFLARHGQGHRLMPSEVNYRANIYGMKLLGVESIISLSACGSLQEHIRPGDVVIPDQIFDMTKQRDRTFFGDGIVAHVSAAEPFCPDVSRLLLESVPSEGRSVHKGGCYVQIEGPRYSTRGESRAYRAWGMDIVGMTTAPEAFLAREAGICYALVALVTDYDSWKTDEEPVSVEIVVETLHRNARVAETAVKRVVPKVAGMRKTCSCNTPVSAFLQSDDITDEARRRLGPILE